MWMSTTSGPTDLLATDLLPADNIFLICTLCIIREVVALFQIFTLLIIKEITSSPVTFCILQFLCLLCIFRYSRRSLYTFSEYLTKIAKSRPTRFVFVPYPWKIKEIIQAGIGNAAQVWLCTLQFLCLFYFLAKYCIIKRTPKRHPRSVRQHDLWSHGWHIMALLIWSLTSQVLVVDFCPVKKVWSWMLIDRAFIWYLSFMFNI